LKLLQSWIFLQHIKPF
jgi:hypothetical protein